MASQHGLTPVTVEPEGRLYVGAPHDYATPRTTADGPEYGSNGPSMYSVRPGQAGDSMWTQPAWIVAPGRPAQHAQPDIARGLYEVSGSALPTFVPRGYRADQSNHGATSPGFRTAYLIVPPDRWNALANHGGGNRRGGHDVRRVARSGGVPSQRKIFGIPVGG